MEKQALLNIFDAMQGQFDAQANFILFVAVCLLIFFIVSACFHAWAIIKIRSLETRLNSSAPASSS
jgi:hypothetical protein